jgi:hypothetical protein
MKVKKIATVAIILLFGCTSFVFCETNKSGSDTTEADIMKALGDISTITVLKSAKPKIVYESEPMVLGSDKPKVTKKQTKVKRVKRKYRRATQTKASMEELPMAKSYPMSYDVSKITE